MGWANGRGRRNRGEIAEGGIEMDDDTDVLAMYESAMICPVTGQVCMTEQDEFCEDYGCARKAGIDVDRDLIP